MICKEKNAIKIFPLHNLPSVVVHVCILIYKYCFRIIIHYLRVPQIVILLFVVWFVIAQFACTLRHLLKGSSSPWPPPHKLSHNDCSIAWHVISDNYWTLTYNVINYDATRLVVVKKMFYSFCVLTAPYSLCEGRWVSSSFQDIFQS